MAKYAYHLYPKGDVDYTLTTNDHPRVFVPRVLKNGMEVAAANSSTRHEFEQMYMDNPDGTFGKAFNKSVFVSESRRDSIKKGITRVRKSINGLSNVGG